MIILSDRCATIVNENDIVAVNKVSYPSDRNFMLEFLFRHRDDTYIIRYGRDEQVRDEDYCRLMDDL